MNKKWAMIVTVLLCIMVFVSACSEGNTAKPEPTNESIEPGIEQATPSPTPVVPAYFALLTGKAMEEQIDTRPVAVLINNLAPARPQSGLTEADIIWEVLAEGGITRLVAIFQSTPNNEFDLGPVRSNRPYFIEIADSFDAIIAHAGASNDAYAILQRQDKPYLDEISNAGKYYWRSSERKAPHNLYTNLSKLREGASAKGYREQSTIQGYSFMTEEEAATASIGSAKKLEVQFQLKSYRVGYSFDETNRVYKRSINDEPHIDKNTDEALFANNLIFMQTEHKVLDKEGRLSVDLQSGGEALVIQNGEMIEGKWVAAADGMIRFVKDGADIKLVPGKSFIHVLPLGKSILEHINIE